LRYTDACFVLDARSRALGSMRWTSSPDDLRASLPRLAAADGAG
jgi:hypothetical protein